MSRGRGPKLWDPKLPIAKPPQRHAVPAHPGMYEVVRPDINDVDYALFYREQIQRENKFFIENQPNAFDPPELPWATGNNFTNEHQDLDAETRKPYRSPAIIARSTMARTIRAKHELRRTGELGAASGSQPPPPAHSSRARAPASRGGEPATGSLRRARSLRLHGLGSSRSAVVHSPISTGHNRSAALDRALADMRMRRTQDQARSPLGRGSAHRSGAGAGAGASGALSPPRRAVPGVRDRGFALGYAGFRQGRTCLEEVPPAQTSPELVAATRALTRSLGDALFPPNSLHHSEDHHTRHWKKHEAEVGPGGRLRVAGARGGGDADGAGRRGAHAAELGHADPDAQYHRQRGQIPGYGGFTQYLDTMVEQHMELNPRATMFRM